MLWDTDGEPIFVNEKGTKFWLDRALTRYAANKGLSKIVVYLIEAQDGAKSRMIVKDTEPIFESPSYEGIAARLDMLSFLEK